MERNEYQEEKYTKFIYSSKRRIQRRVLQLEKLTAEPFISKIKPDKVSPYLVLYNLSNVFLRFYLF